MLMQLTKKRKLKRTKKTKYKKKEKRKQKKWISYLQNLLKMSVSVKKLRIALKTHFYNELVGHGSKILDKERSSLQNAG